MFGAGLYVIRQHQGRLDEIADIFIDAARDNPSIASLRSAVLCMLCELGRIDEARERLAAEVATGLDFPFDSSWLAAMSDLADAAVLTGDQAVARMLVDRLAPFADHVVSPAVLVRGAIARPLARAATLLGEYEQAEHWFATHTTSTPDSKHRSTPRAPNSTTPTSASPATARATSNTPIISRELLQPPQPNTAAVPSRHAPTQPSRNAEAPARAA